MKNRSMLLAAIAASALLFLTPLQSMALTSSEQPNTNQKAAGGATETVQSATAVLKDAMSGPSNRIPASVLQNAAGIAIIPNVFRAGFIAGGRHGSGVLLTHKGSNWSLPVFISLSGGSIGLQAGATSTDVVLVFENPSAMNDLINGTVTLGTGVTVAAGPEGANAQATTRGADVLSYHRTQGLFAGVSFKGSQLSLDRNTTRSYYDLGQGTTTGYYPSVNDIVSMNGKANLRQAPAQAKELQTLLEQYASPVQR